MKVLMAYPDNCDGSAYHRLHVPALNLRRYGVGITRIDDIFSISEQQLADHDVLIINRLITKKVIPEAPMALTTEAIERVKRSGIRLVVDIDDTWNIPAQHPFAAHYAKTMYRLAAMATIDAADEVWCSTVSLVSEVSRLDIEKHVELVPNGISPLDRQWHHIDRQHDPELRMGVVCNQAHLRDVKRLRDALHALRKLSNWRLMVIGVPVANQQEVRSALKCKHITFLPWLSVYDYAKHYASIDVLLCPLEHTAFNTYRSPIKLSECAFTNTPALCEDFGPYAGTDNAVKDWCEALKQAVKDPSTLKERIPRRTDHLSSHADHTRLDRLKVLVKGVNPTQLT